MAAKPYDPAAEGAEMAFAGRMSYGDYLRLDRILDAQAPLSDAHDEMLFIIQHQTSELWMRLAIHELDAARAALRRDALPPAFKMLARVARIFEQLNSAWDVLRTMTPSEYTSFRAALGQSSRLPVATSTGASSSSSATAIGHAAPARPPSRARRGARGRAGAPLALRRGAAAARPQRHRGARRRSSTRDVVAALHAVAGVQAAWAEVYRAPEAHWPLYELAEKLVDFEDYFRRWRFNHVTTVERVIGFKRGTGGTGGVSYLKRMLEVELFPELWHLRTEL